MVSVSSSFKPGSTRGKGNISVLLASRCDTSGVATSFFGLVGAPTKALRRGLTDFTLCRPSQHGKTPLLVIRCLQRNSKDRLCALSYDVKKFSWGYFLSLEYLFFFKLLKNHKSKNIYISTSSRFFDFFQVPSEAPEFVDSCWALGRGQSQAATREGAASGASSGASVAQVVEVVEIVEISVEFAFGIFRNFQNTNLGTLHMASAVTLKISLCLTGNRNSQIEGPPWMLNVPMDAETRWVCYSLCVVFFFCTMFALSNPKLQAMSHTNAVVVPHSSWS